MLGLEERRSALHLVLEMCTYSACTSQKDSAATTDTLRHPPLHLSLPPPSRHTLMPPQLIERNAPGYAIGGLAGGETKDMFWRVVAQCAAGLPPGKPRYVMGIGYPLDVVVCSALGADMYDSVYPTRTARFGVALVDSGGWLADACMCMCVWCASTPTSAGLGWLCETHAGLQLSRLSLLVLSKLFMLLVGRLPRTHIINTFERTLKGTMKLKNSKFAKDMRPIDETCSCMVCKQYTRSFLHHAIKAQGMAAPAILVTYHNVAYMQVCWRELLAGAGCSHHQQLQ